MLRLWPRPWTDGELEIARSLAGQTREELVAALIGRSADEIGALIEEQGIATTRKRRATARWSRSELQSLRAHFHIGGAMGAGVHLPGRLPGEIQAKADELGLVQFSVEWTQAEDDAVRSGYREHGAIGMQKSLPGRSVSAIKNRVHFLGLSAPADPSLAEEAANRTAFLITNEGLLTASECAKELGISVKAVRDRARAIGVAFRPMATSRIWSDEEQVLARSAFQYGGWDGLFSAFPQLSLANLTTLVRTIGLTSDLIRDKKAWTVEELSVLKADGERLGLRAVAGRLQRHPAYVLRRALVLGINLRENDNSLVSKPAPMLGAPVRPWAPHEAEALAAAVSAGGIALAVSMCAGRSVAEVLHQATRQGVWPRAWTEGELDELTRWWGAAREVLIARLPARSYDDMWNAAHMRGIVRTDWWGPFAVRQVFDLYLDGGPAAVHAVLPERSTASVEGYVEAAGLNSPGALLWSALDDDRLRWAIKAGGVEEAISTLRDRDPRVVRARATALGLLLEGVVRSVDPRRAPNKTVDFIREAAPTSSIADIASALVLTPDEVRMICHTFDIPLLSPGGRRTGPWSSTEDAALIEAWRGTEGMTRAKRELACTDAVPGRTTAAIKFRAHHLGLRNTGTQATSQNLVRLVIAHIRGGGASERNKVIAAKFGVSVVLVRKLRKETAVSTTGT